MMNTTQYQWAQIQRSGSRVNRKRFGLLPSRVVVDELHHAVRFRDGVIVDVLRPGVHWLRPRSEQFATLSALPQTLTVKSQEILTSDGITVRATVATIVRIVDPIVALRAGDWQSQLYLCVQLALRSEVTSRDLETLVGERDGVDGPLLEATRNVGQQLGVEVTQLGRS